MAQERPQQTPRQSRSRLRRIAWWSGAGLVLALVLAFFGFDVTGILGRFLLKTDEIVIERTPDPVYERLFPRYVELCALSQPTRKDKGRGNPFGHALMYLKGACKDETAPFPQLRPCRAIATDLDDPEHGAGVSVGRWFRNVNWVATPGYRLFFEGNLAPGQPLTQAHYDATVDDAIARGVFDGVDLHDEWRRRAGPGLRTFVANGSIGTDFALRYSRNVFCARIPVSAPVMDEVIAFLNDKNREYASGEADYNWRLLANNCVHTVRNALAAANVWSPLSVLDVRIRHLFNLAVPANEFVNLAVLGTTAPPSDVREIQADGPSRDALHEFRWLPSRHGALLKTLPVHEPNDVFRTDFRLFTVQSPFRMGQTMNAVRLLSDARYTDLEANLRTFRETYDTILTTLANPADRFESVRGSPYRRVERLYRDYIETQLREVDAMLERIAAETPRTAPAAPPETPPEDAAGSSARLQATP